MAMATVLPTVSVVRLRKPKAVNDWSNRLSGEKNAEWSSIEDPVRKGPVPWHRHGQHERPRRWNRERDQGDPHQQATADHQPSSAELHEQD
jgi:hypothetical protein